MATSYPKASAVSTTHTDQLTISQIVGSTLAYLRELVHPVRFGPAAPLPGNTLSDGAERELFGHQY